MEGLSPEENRRFKNGKVAVLPSSSSPLPLSSPPGRSSIFSTPSKACIISVLMVSKSSSEMPMRFIMSSTWGNPRSLAHLRHNPSLMGLSPSSLEMNTTATFFLHLEQSVGCIVYLQKIQRPPPLRLQSTPPVTCGTPIVKCNSPPGRCPAAAAARPVKPEPAHPRSGPPPLRPGCWRCGAPAASTPSP